MVRVVWRRKLRATLPPVLCRRRTVAVLMSVVALKRQRDEHTIRVGKKCGHTWAAIAATPLVSLQADALSASK
eukprot:2797348-Pleurochrysis_carterae.AAC.1